MLVLAIAVMAVALRLAGLLLAGLRLRLLLGRLRRLLRGALGPLIEAPVMAVVAPEEALIGELRVVLLERTNMIRRTVSTLSAAAVLAHA